ncbi:hypothetical protein M427DRAFT_412083 [Gonapodya prolifera JEL478]|uniref:Secreted protein n=1 Tax=Gonapodya prolifera (strain JEL478) TaxID=1344416 RepID=A0A139A5A6_GONPJ|nr:hypothetical protein M427DRAFT_412083 [Gonapodya prolifera JEL478]|eukprot:KXS12002.1 hypothetical protein M427DRAFT_412083 [Gonapodya prolifera JEL478]
MAVAVLVAHLGLVARVKRWGVVVVGPLGHCKRKSRDEGATRMRITLWRNIRSAPPLRNPTRPLHHPPRTRTIPITLTIRS